MKSLQNQLSLKTLQRMLGQMRRHTEKRIRGAHNFSVQAAGRIELACEQLIKRKSTQTPIANQAADKVTPSLVSAA